VPSCAPEPSSAGGSKPQAARVLRALGAAAGYRARRSLEAAMTCEYRPRTPSLSGAHCRSRTPHRRSEEAALLVNTSADGNSSTVRDHNWWLTLGIFPYLSDTDPLALACSEYSQHFCTYRHGCFRNIRRQNNLAVPGACALKDLAVAAALQIPMQRHNRHAAAGWQLLQ
jgi:hypothetical protein